MPSSQHNSLSFVELDMCIHFLILFMIGLAYIFMSFFWKVIYVMYLYLCLTKLISFFLFRLIRKFNGPKKI